MPILKLTNVPAETALTVVCDALHTVEELPFGHFSDAPAAGAVIRYVAGAEVRPRVVAEDFDMLVAGRPDLFVAEMANSKRFAFLPSDAIAVEALDPEAPASNGCTVQIDLVVAGVSIGHVQGKADAAEISARMTGEGAGTPIAVAAPARQSKRRPKAA
jgi:hypothetical protein